MNEQILSPATVTERKSEEARRAGYAAPRMFAVGSTVELIQGKWVIGRVRDFDNSFFLYPA